jgi:anion-transporting  ArsA/GET3 family ATPase
MAAMALTHIDHLRFAFVTGKGGVGKTTVTAALARRFAKDGRRVLIAMCNAKERMSDMFGVPPIGSEVTEVHPGIWAVNMDPEAALEEYGAMTLKSRGLYALLFGNQYVRTFFRAVPGIHEWAMLGKAWWHTTEERSPGVPKYDVVILDAPATGHGLDMLRVPKVIVDVVPPGLLRRDAERAWTMFQDPRQTGAILVALPEEMPTTETLELAASMRSELKIPLAGVVMNAVLPVLFNEAQGIAMANIDEAAFATNTPENDAIRMARRRAIRERIQKDSITRLTLGIGEAPTLLPLLFEDAARPAAVAKLAALI